jgi:hypothetical protein
MANSRKHRTPYNIPNRRIDNVKSANKFLKIPDNLLGVLLMYDAYDKDFDHNDNVIPMKK